MQVRIFKGKAWKHVDKRRRIDNAVLKESVQIPFSLRHFELINLFQEAADQGLAVGNHYHIEESGKYEFFVILGESSKSPAFKFRFRKPGQKTQEVEMRVGDACFIPPTWSHAFLPLVSGVNIFGFSNLEYNSKHDIADKLF